MNGEEMRRIREHDDLLEVRQREQRQELRNSVLSSVERDDAISISRRTILIGLIPSGVAFVVRTLGHDWTAAFQLVFGLMCFAISCLFVVASASIACGLFAHWWFHDTGYSVRRVAFVLALLVNVALFGWAIVLTQ